MLIADNLKTICGIYMGMNKQKQGLSTKCVHSGTGQDKAWNAVVTPIYQTTTFRVPDLDALVDRHVHKKGYTYTTSGNPTQLAAEEKIAALEGTESAAVFSSGMGAITAAINSIVKAGDEIIAQKDLYGDTFSFIDGLDETRTIKAKYFETTDASQIEELITDKTKIIYLETPTNPLLKLVDIKKATSIAKKYGVTSILDNTFASPINQQPHSLGVDIVVQSATKSLSGHHHVVCGAAAGSLAHIKAIKSVRGLYGQVLDPFGAFLLNTGIQTMALRMRQMNQNALALAKLLNDSPKVTHVYYPGLESHPQHKLASQQMKGYSSMISFELKDGLDAIAKMLKGLSFVKLATSLGGVDTIATVPAISMYHSKTAEERQAIGIQDGLMRISVGIEDTDDLLAEFSNALSMI